MTELGEMGDLSLRLGLDVTRTKAVLRSAEPFGADLTHLAAGFPVGGQRGPLTLEVPLDDFLSGIHVLSDWPHAESVEWDEELLTLVNDVLDDADQAADYLDHSPEPSEGVDAGSLSGRLGTGWRADLTSFQRRDIARLLSMRHGANFSVPGRARPASDSPYTRRRRRRATPVGCWSSARSPPTSRGSPRAANASTRRR